MRGSPQPDMNLPIYPPSVISALLREAGWTQARIAMEVGCSKASVSYAIHAGSDNKITKKISLILGIPSATLWPQRHAVQDLSSSESTQK